MKKVGMGLIGCGGMGRSVARSLLRESPRLEVRGLYDPDKRAIRLTLDNVNSSATVYPDFKSLCRAPDIDWVMIASWNSFHKEYAIAALNAGKDSQLHDTLVKSLELPEEDQRDIIKELVG